MCANYRPSAREMLLEHFRAHPPAAPYKGEIWPGYDAPIIRRGEDGQRECTLGTFGLIPYWAADAKIARKTYNARSETVAEKPSYRHAWRQAQFGLVPMQAFFEPNWETGRAVRWRIELGDDAPFAAAAIWERWRDRATGTERVSFSMLTINADDHALMRRFHGPDDEKRMIVVVPPHEYDDWLYATPEIARTFMVPYPDTLLSAEPDPLRRG